MAFRQIINKVLTRLREDTITSDWTGDINDSSDVDDYQKLIGELVNQSKHLVENAWDWGVLRTVETVATSSGTVSYTMSNLDYKARIMQVLDDTNDSELKHISDKDFYRFTYIGDSQTGQPMYYRLKNNEISFWPTPDAAYNIRVHAVQPQDDLTTATETMTIPEHPVVLGAYSMAISERGEDGGTMTDLASSMFSNALSDAISQDENRTVNETTWYAD